jgi:hypothetical protein
MPAILLYKVLPEEQHFGHLIAPVTKWHKQKLLLRMWSDVLPTLRSKGKNVIQGRKIN